MQFLLRLGMAMEQVGFAPSSYWKAASWVGCTGGLMATQVAMHNLTQPHSPASALIAAIVMSSLQVPYLTGLRDRKIYFFYASSFLMASDAPPVPSACFTAGSVSPEKRASGVDNYYAEKGPLEKGPLDQNGTGDSDILSCTTNMSCVNS